MIVYTQGSFDIVHSGHLNIFKRCRQLAGEGGKVVVSLVSDEFYKSYRGHQPAKPYSERQNVLLSFKDVDEVIRAEKESTRTQILDEVKPDYVVLGSDWVSKDIYAQYGMTREELNPLLVFIPYTTSISSTQIKERIKNDSI